LRKIYVMNRVLIFPIIFLCSVLCAQESYHVVPGGSEWKLETTDITIRYFSIVTEVGDEQIGGEMCQKIQVQGYTRYAQGMEMTWGPLIVGNPSFLYLRRNGINIEIYQNNEWNLLFKTQTYLGEVWYQGLAEGVHPVYVKVVDVNENSGDIFTQPCTQSGDLIEIWGPNSQGVYGPFWGVYNVFHISERMNMLGTKLPINFINCPVLNYSCFNEYPIVGWLCESDMLTLSLEAEMQNVLQIFPNPSAQGFFVSGITEPANILVYDFSGALVAQFQNQIDASTFMDMSHLKSGVYAVQIQTPAQIANYRWVKVD